MAKRASGRDATTTFEIVIVLAIVAIVAVTGQVLIYFDKVADNQPVTLGNSPTGFVISDSTSTHDASITDLSISRIEVNPASPLVGDPFEATVYIKNNGNQEIKTPFFVDLTFIPKTEETDVALESKSLQTMVPQILAPGQETSVSFLVSTIIPEGPMRLVATVDYTGKIADDNYANNQMSKTIILATE